MTISLTSLCDIGLTKFLLIAADAMIYIIILHMYICKSRWIFFQLFL